MLWDLKLQTGRVIKGWEGDSGEAAARSYVARHTDAAVIATRPARRTNLVLAIPDARRIEIIEPGHRDYGRR